MSQECSFCHLHLEGKCVDFILSYRDSVAPTFSLVAGKSIQHMISVYLRVTF